MRELLSEKDTLLFDSRLAIELGINQTFVLLQLAYWLKRRGKKMDDGIWIYKTVRQWKEQDFPFMSEKTITRALNDLEEKEIIISGNFNHKKYDRTKWYRINRRKVDELLNQIDKKAQDNMTNAFGQFDQMEEDNLTTPIPENNKENKDSIINNTEVSQNQDQNLFEKLNKIVKVLDLDPKYCFIPSQILTIKNLSNAEAEPQTNNEKNEELNLEKIEEICFMFRPLPEFSIKNKRDFSSFVKMYLSYLKHFQKFPTHKEMVWIQNARKQPKKAFSPSEVEQAVETASKDGYTGGFGDAFTNYMWNSRTNFAKPVKKESTAKRQSVIEVDDFSEFQ